MGIGLFVEALTAYVLLEVDELTVVRWKEVPESGSAAIAHVVDYCGIFAFFLGQHEEGGQSFVLDGTHGHFVGVAFLCVLLGEAYHLKVGSYGVEVGACTLPEFDEVGLIVGRRIYSFGLIAYVVLSDHLTVGSEYAVVETGLEVERE